MAAAYAPPAAKQPDLPGPQAPELSRLYGAARAGHGEVLRISPHRTVWRLRNARGDWVLKAYHPHRRAERLRSLLRRPPALRELAILTQLQARMGLDLPGPATAEQVTPSLGLFARPWWEGRPAVGRLATHARETGAALAAWHAAGWSDPDLLPDDLIWHAGQLVPVDFGHARAVLGAASPLAQRRDLIRFLIALTPTEVRQHGAELLAGHADAGGDAGSAAEILSLTALERRLAMWRQSRRCLRTNRDFAATALGAQRRSLPDQQEAPNTLGTSRRGQVTQRGDLVVKEYRRASLWQTARLQLGLGPGRKAYRWLYALELHGLPAVEPLAWRRTDDGEELCTRYAGDESPGTDDLPSVAAWLASLHRADLTLRDAKQANFRVASGRGLLLVDPDGLRHGAKQRERDLGRLLADCEPGSACEAAVLAAYESSSGSDAAFAALARKHAARFRDVLAARA